MKIYYITIGCAGTVLCIAASKEEAYNRLSYYPKQYPHSKYLDKRSIMAIIQEKELSEVLEFDK